METKITQLFTKWGENFDTKHVLQEYPRPTMKRDSYINLNGFWDYAFAKTTSIPEKFEGKILVPFSPESELSGVKRQLMPDEVLWYSRTFSLEQILHVGKVLLHFGAVDQYCRVFINRKQVGKHWGGYLPFTLDITKYLTAGINSLLVMVKDLSDTSYHSRGKQKIKRGGMFYTAQSGIWQTVWIESVADNYIEKLKITPQYDESSICVKVKTKKTVECNVKIFRVNDLYIEKKIRTNENNRIDMQDFRSWSPEDPFLYNVEFSTENDNVESYFAMRKCSVKKDKKGVMRLFLNNRPYFHNGVLDQGYWPEGLYTAPTDKALSYDILKLKELGFNMIRKHVKVEPLRWYYHCDRIGMLVWQDMVNGGEIYNMSLVCYLPNILPNIINNMKDNQYELFGRKSRRGRREYIRELKQMIELLYNHPSIVMWVPFNEGWGQFDAKAAVQIIKRADRTRIIDHASGWYDQRAGDVKSIHIYFRKVRIRKENRAVVLSEFGGYSCLVSNHSFSSKVYGYRRYHSLEELSKGYQKLYQTQVIPLIEDGLAATVYTQVSDVEDEVNGIMTYDRKIVKMDEAVVKSINQQLMNYNLRNRIN